MKQLANCFDRISGGLGILEDEDDQGNWEASGALFVAPGDSRRGRGLDGEKTFRPLVKFFRLDADFSARDSAKKCFSV